MNNEIICGGCNSPIERLEDGVYEPNVQVYFHNPYTIPKQINLKTGDSEVKPQSQCPTLYILAQTMAGNPVNRLGPFIPMTQLENIAQKG